MADDDDYEAPGGFFSALTAPFKLDGSTRGKDCFSKDGFKYKRFNQIWDEKVNDWARYKPKKKYMGGEEDAIFIVYKRRYSRQDRENPFTVVEITSALLQEAVRSDMKELSTLYRDNAFIPTSEFYQYIPAFRAKISELEELAKAIALEKNEFEGDSDDDDGYDASTLRTTQTGGTKRPNQVWGQPVPAPTTAFGKFRGMAKVANKEKSTSTTQSKVIVGDGQNPEAQELGLMAAYLRAFLEFVEEDFSPVLKMLNRLLDEGQITFDLLWAVFKPGMKIGTTDKASGEPVRTTFALSSSLPTPF